MRWDRLFDDLEGQLAHELDAEEVDLSAQEERLRLARVSLRERVAAMAEPGRPERAPLRLVLRSGETVLVRASAVGRDWIAGERRSETGPVGQVVVPLAAIASILPTAAQLEIGLHAQPPGEAAVLSGRLGLGFVLRDLCRRRASVDLDTAFGRLHGTIDRVARDHLDLAEHDAGEPRRDAAVARVRIVPLAALDLVGY